MERMRRLCKVYWFDMAVLTNVLRIRRIKRDVVVWVEYYRALQKRPHSTRSPTHCLPLTSTSNFFNCTRCCLSGPASQVQVFPSLTALLLDTWGATSLQVSIGR